jgi:hypothetical protein
MKYQPIESAPIGETIFVAIGVTQGNGFTGGKPYVTDPFCVWQEIPGVFTRWPHSWPPTHWCELPDNPKP